MYLVKKYKKMDTIRNISNYTLMVLVLSVAVVDTIMVITRQRQSSIFCIGLQNGVLYGLFRILLNSIILFIPKIIEATILYKIECNTFKKDKELALNHYVTDCLIWFTEMTILCFVCGSLNAIFY